MKLGGIGTIETAVTSALLIPTYILILWHNWKGSQFTFIYLVVSFFLVANCSLLAVTQAGHSIFDKNNLTAFYLWDFGINAGLVDLGLCVSHLLLAFQYRKIAKEAPYAAEGVQYPAAKRRRERNFFRVLLPLNVFFPVAESVLTVLYYGAYLNPGKVSA